MYRRIRDLREDADLSQTELAKKLGINQAIIWDLMKDVERKIAKRRGLL